MKKLYTTATGGISIKDANEIVPKDYIELDLEKKETMLKWCDLNGKHFYRGEVQKEYYKLFLLKKE